MINLENELLQDILNGVADANAGVTPQDIQIFFEKSKDRIKRLVEIKELHVTQARVKLKKLQARPSKNKLGKSSSVVDRILDDLVGRLAIAKLEFNDKKQVKYDNLVKQLKIAVISKRTPTIVKCLYDINTLQMVVKDIKMADLQEQIAKYSQMANSKGKAYLKVYSEQEQQEDLISQILVLTTEIQALNTILNQT